jgi:hypothetical protein
VNLLGYCPNLAMAIERENIITLLPVEQSRVYLLTCQLPLEPRLLRNIKMPPRRFPKRQEMF